MNFAGTATAERFDWGSPLVDTPERVVRDDVVTPRGSWSAIVRPGDTLTIIDVGGNQSADFLVYAAEDTTTRYSVQHTLAAQRNAYLRTGAVLLSNTGAPLMTLVGNEVDRQDTIGGRARRNPTLCATATTPSMNTRAGRTSSPKALAGG